MRRAARVAGFGLAGAIAVGALVLCVAGGCSNAGYYWQSARGHLDILARAKPVQQWLDDPATSQPLRERLLLTQQLRDYAVAQMKLPDNRSYRSYTQLDRPAALWNVAAAPELSLTLKTWCFPVAGCVAYRGYYAQGEALAEAQQLRAQGFDAVVQSIPAYSTLGWFDWLGGDPLLSSFVRLPEGELARLIFHELAHQVVYAKDDTEFNESFATAVERIGGRRWLAERAGPDARREYAQYDERRKELRQLLRATRERLAAVYRSDTADDAKRAAKAQALQALRDHYETLKRERWGGWAGFDAWVAQTNNASLGMQSAYDRLVPAFEALFEREGRDFARFYAEVRRLARLPKEERRSELESLLPRGDGATP